jgi:hypothetical protein
MLILIASAIYIGATSFEVAQNSADRWYLTEATRSVADLFFNSFMTVAFCMYTIGFLGLNWVGYICIALTLIYPFAYIQNHPAHRGINGTVVMIATVALYLITNDPVVFLFMLGNAVGVYFITFLVKRLAQWLHGLAAFFFGLGFLAWPWAIVNAGNNTQMSWLTFGVSCGIAIAALAALTPLLSKAKATPRVYA